MMMDSTMFALCAIILAILVSMEAYSIARVARKSINELTFQIIIHAFAIFDFGINETHRCASPAILPGKQILKQIILNFFL